MPNSVNQVQPALEFIPAAFNPLVLRGTQLIFPLWLKLQTSISDIQAENVETLAALYQQFNQGKVRLLMAFRHPSADDPSCMGYLAWRLLPQIARQKGIVLPSPTHFHFIYDRGIPLWAGSTIGWLYSQLGGTPIHRGKLDRMGLRAARELFVNGKFPMAASPEGATNGHNEVLSPLEPGIAQMGFWCVEDLQKAGRSEEVLIVPIGIQYEYLTPPWQPLEQLLTALELDSGLSPLRSETSLVILYQRLTRLGGHLLEMMEEFYRRFYHRTLPDLRLETRLETREATGNGEHTNAMLNARLNALLDVALQVAEEHFNLTPKGSLIDRCRRLEQAGWDSIYRDDIKDVAALSPLERGLADRVAEEARLRMWHMRLVESFVAVTGQYVKEKPSVERFAETTLILWDVITRIKGGNAFARPKLGRQRVQMKVGQPISISGRWDAYKASRRGAVDQLTQDLQTALESMIQV